MNLRKINVHEIGDFIFFPNRAVDSKNVLIKGISVRTLIPSPRPFPFEIFTSSTHRPEAVYHGQELLSAIFSLGAKKKK